MADREDREKRAATAVATSKSKYPVAVEAGSALPPARKQERASQQNITALTYKKYPGEQQVELSVKIDMPGSWFSGTAIGGLTTAEKKEKYVAMCVEYKEAYVFEPEDTNKRKPAKISPAVRFICPEDAASDADHPGFWIELEKWNRYRNDTYKDNRDAEVRFARRALRLWPIPARASFACLCHN